MKSILFIIQTDPYASAAVTEAIDMAYAAAVFDLEVAVLFIGPGIACLVKDQQSPVLEKKSIEKKVAALPIYGVERLYYDGYQSGIALDRIIKDAISLNADAQTALLSQFHEIQVF